MSSKLPGIEMPAPEPELEPMTPRVDPIDNIFSYPNDGNVYAWPYNFPHSGFIS